MNKSFDNNINNEIFNHNGKNNDNNIFINDDISKALLPKQQNDAFRSCAILPTRNIESDNFQKSKSFSIEISGFQMLELNEKFHYGKSSGSIMPFNTQSKNKNQNFQKTFEQKQNNIDDEPIIFVESKFSISSNSNNAKNNNALSPPMIYNKYSSCTIKKNDANVVLQKMCKLLKNYSHEIDFKVDEKNYTIEGVVFIRNRAIYWIITIWEEEMKLLMVTKLEFQKRRGDCTGFQNFWSDMLNKIDEEFGSVNVEDAQRCNNFENLFVPLYDFCEPMKFDDEELNKLQEMLDDDYHEIASDALSLLCCRLENDVAFRKLVSKHEPLMKTLTQTVLTHVDSSHIRGALKALELIAGSRESCMDQLIGQYEALSTTIHLLQHGQTLIRKHAVRLLALLSQYDWQLSNNQCLQIEEQLKKLQNEWNVANQNSYNIEDYDINYEKEFVSWEMFDAIEKRVLLSAKN